MSEWLETHLCLGQTEHGDQVEVEHNGPLSECPVCPPDPACDHEWAALDYVPMVCRHCGTLTKGSHSTSEPPCR